MMRKLLLVLFAFYSLSTISLVHAEPPTIRIAVLKFGTVIWELETIKRFNLDRKFGFNLHIQEIAGKQAAAVMLQTGATDAIVSDWIWAARQWSAGRKFVVLPYSKAVGGIVVRDRNITSVADLRHKRIAIAGGPLDKNWLMLRAYARRRHGFDLAASATLVYASAPIVYRKMLDGEFDAAINFWPYLARSRARGLRFLTTTKKMSAAVGLAVEAPLLCYLFPRDWWRKNRELVRAFGKSSQAAKAILRQNKAAWIALKPRMKVASGTEYDALKTDFVAGMPAADGWPALSRMQSWLDFLRQNGGAKLVGKATKLVPEMFLSTHE